MSSYLDAYEERQVAEAKAEKERKARFRARVKQKQAQFDAVARRRKFCDRCGKGPITSRIKHIFSLKGGLLSQGYFLCQPCQAEIVNLIVAPIRARIEARRAEAAPLLAAFRARVQAQMEARKPELDAIRARSRAATSSLVDELRAKRGLSPLAGPPAAEPKKKPKRKPATPRAGEA